MKKINIIKIVLDILMSVVFVLMFNKMAVVGLAFHEIGGLALGLAILIHIGLNWRWVKQVTLKLFNPNLNFKTRLGYAINLLLLICFAFIIISGIFISKVVFPGLGSGGAFIFKMLHIPVSYLALILIGVHIGLHWNWILSMFKNIFKFKNNSKASKAIGAVAIAFVLLFGGYSLYSSKLITRISPIAFSINSDKSPIEGKEGSSINPVEGKVKGDKNIEGFSKAVRTEGGHGGALGGGSNTLQTLAKYLSIVGLFSMITAFIEKLLRRKNRKVKLLTY